MVDVERAWNAAVYDEQDVLDRILSLLHSICFECGGAIKVGTALGQTMVPGIEAQLDPDGLGTYSAGGPGYLMDVYKCVDCGHSFKKGSVR
jgi:hypothetical protein